MLVLLVTAFIFWIHFSLINVYFASTMVQILCAGNNLANEQTVSRMINLLRQLQQTLPPSTLASTWSSLQPQQQLALQSILSSQQFWSEDACLLSWDVIVTFSEAALSGQIHSFGIFGVSFFEAAVSGSCFMIVESILGFASQDLSKALLQRQSSVELVGQETVLV